MSGPLLAALAAATAAPQPIAFHLLSWGRPVLEWRIAPDGGLAYAQAKGDGPLVTHHAPAAPARYAWVAKRLAGLRARAGRGLACTPTMTDLPYGDLSWGTAPGAPRLPLRFGCKEAGTVALLNRLGAVTTQVGRWAHVTDEGKNDTP